MDLTEIRSRIRAVARDSSNTFHTDPIIDDLVNEAYLDLVARLGLIHSEQSKNMGDSGTSVANGTIDLPTDYIRVLTLRLGDDDVQFVDDEVFWSHYDVGSSPSNTLGRVFNDKIEMYPLPASGQATKLRYIKKPTALSAGADSPSIPEELQSKIVDYARAHVKYKEGEFGAGDRYLAMYEDNLPPLPHLQRRLPGPIVLSPSGSYFEASEYLD